MKAITDGPQQYDQYNNLDENPNVKHGLNRVGCVPSITNEIKNFESYIINELLSIGFENIKDWHA